MSRKKDKNIAHAKMVWERDQLQAATANEQIDKAYAVVLQYKDELTEQQFKDVEQHMAERKEEVKEFLLKSRDKYVKKMAMLTTSETMEFELTEEDLP